MLKLIRGIIDFREKIRPQYRETFAKLALGQRPDTLFVACSDSRVVPNLFASTDPGDLFVVRNVGNLIPECNLCTDTSHAESAAIEFSLKTLSVRDIIICGHSECGAMLALLSDRNKLESKHVAEWLSHADSALEDLNNNESMNPKLSKHNQLSQLNVLTQMKHLKSYPFIQERVENGALRIHGWWFDIAGADVYAYDEHTAQFELIDGEHARKLVQLFEKDK